MSDAVWEKFLSIEAQRQELLEAFPHKLTKDPSLQPYYDEAIAGLNASTAWIDKGIDYAGELETTILEARHLQGLVSEPSAEELRQRQRDRLSTLVSLAKVVEYTGQQCTERGERLFQAAINVGAIALGEHGEVLDVRPMNLAEATPEQLLVRVSHLPADLLNGELKISQIWELLNRNSGTRVKLDRSTRDRLRRAILESKRFDHNGVHGEGSRFTLKPSDDKNQDA